MAIGTLHSFDMHRGDTRAITYTVVDEAGAAVDINGALFIWILAEQDPSSPFSPQPLPASAIVTKTESAGIVIVDGPNGKIQIDIDSDDTGGLEAPKAYYHEVQITLAGKVNTLVFGNITLKREIAAPGPGP